MRIAAIYPQFYKYEPKVLPTFNEPLGLEYIAAMAKKQGHNVKLFIPVKSSNKTNSRIQSVNEKQFVENIKKYNPDIAAFSVMTCQVNAMLDIAKELKKTNPKIIIIVGGYHPSAALGLLNKKYIDIIVVGECEYTFVELLDNIEDGKLDYERLQEIKGVAFKKDAEIIFTGWRKRINNLDALPRPIRYEPLIKQKEFGLVYPPPEKQKGVASIMYSKGCPFNCYFCEEPFMCKRKVVHRSAKSVCDEIEYLQRRYGITNVFFTDTNFTINRDKVFEICEEIIERKINIYFEILGSVRTVDEEMLKILSRAGCVKIGWGVESISNRTLSAIRKHIKVSDTEHMLHLAAEDGILNTGFFIIAFPWEDEKTIREEMENLPKYEIYRLRISIATPLPGSAWYEEIKNKGILKKNWKLYDTEHLAYKHPYLTERKIKALQEEFFRKFYKSKEYKRNVKKICKKFPHLKSAFRGYLKTLPFKVNVW